MSNPPAPAPPRPRPRPRPRLPPAMQRGPARVSSQELESQANDLRSVRKATQHNETQRATLISKGINHVIVTHESPIVAYGRQST